MIPTRSISRTQLRSRFLICVVLVVALFSALVMRLMYLQVIQGKRYRFLSENNRIRLERLIAPRGTVLDRNGETLAEMRPSFNAMVVPNQLPKEDRQPVYEELIETLGMELEEIIKVAEGNGPARWKPRVLKRRLTRTEMARLEVRRLDLPGVRVSPSPMRHYPYGELFSGLLGYVGEISSDELASPRFADYEAGDYIGRTGLESGWEDRLRGEAGGAQVEVDVMGRKLGTLAGQPPVPGSTIQLSIDRRLQKAAKEALGDQVGSVVAIDVRNGDLLAMVTHPSYDPNELTLGLSQNRWNEIVSDSRHPLQNRPLQGLYSPGSTFKIPMVFAGLDFGVITPATEVFCNGKYQFAGRAYRCWKKTGHGPVNLKSAMEQSCDVYFYQLGLDLGVDVIHDYAEKFGLGRLSEIDLPQEKSGLIPSKAWKREVKKEPWFPGETLSISIGQGYVLTTPLQLAAMAASVAHPDGVRMRPRLVTHLWNAEGQLVEEIQPEELGVLPFKPTHMRTVRDSMREVVTGAKGTGKRAEVAGFAVAGKTGTSQVVRIKDEGEEVDSDEEVPWRFRDHALFVSYAPYEDPRIAVAVVVDHGGNGSTSAAPVAKKVIETYRDLAAEDVGMAELQ